MSGHWTQDWWCFASSSLGQGVIGLLGLTAVGGFYGVWSRKGFAAPNGPQTEIARAKRALRYAKWLLFLAAALWAATVITYFSAYTALKGKGCDAKFTADNRASVRDFAVAGIALLLVCAVEATLYAIFRKHDRAAREATRS